MNKLFNIIFCFAVATMCFGIFLHARSGHGVVALFFRNIGLDLAEDKSDHAKKTMRVEVDRALTLAQTNQARLAYLQERSKLYTESLSVQSSLSLHSQNMLERMRANMDKIRDMGVTRMDGGPVRQWYEDSATAWRMTEFNNTMRMSGGQSAVDKAERMVNAVASLHEKLNRFYDKPELASERIDTSADMQKLLGQMDRYRDVSSRLSTQREKKNAEIKTKADKNKAATESLKERLDRMQDQSRSLRERMDRQHEKLRNRNF